MPEHRKARPGGSNTRAGRAGKAAFNSFLRPHFTTKQQRLQVADYPPSGHKKRARAQRQEVET